MMTTLAFLVKDKLTPYLENPKRDFRYRDDTTVRNITKIRDSIDSSIHNAIWNKKKAIKNWTNWTNWTN